MDGLEDTQSEEMSWYSPALAHALAFKPEQVPLIFWNRLCKFFQGEWDEVQALETSGACYFYLGSTSRGRVQGIQLCFLCFRLPSLFRPSILWSGEHVHECTLSLQGVRSRRGRAGVVLGSAWCRGRIIACRRHGGFHISEINDACVVRHLVDERGQDAKRLDA